MKCLQCGTEMTARRENHRYTASGLPNVTLVDVEVRRCARCGEYEVAIPAVADLHRVMALHVGKKREQLTPEEIRFLRKCMGWSGVDFARKMGVTPETVSRWERGRLRMSAPAEALLRIWVATFEPDRDYMHEILDHVPDRGKPKRRGLRMFRRAREWEPTEA